MADEDGQGEDWRSAETYRPLLCADASAWAWEFARRARSTAPAGADVPADLCFAGPGPTGAPAPTAMWRFETDPAVPVFQLQPAQADDPAALDVRALPLATLVVSSQTGDQHVLIAHGTRRLRFAVVGGDVLAGPARLGFLLPSRSVGGASLDGVRRLLVLRDTGRLPPAARSDRRRVERWMEALQAFDARRAGASQRQIAALIFGEDRVAEDWNGRSDYMRMRIQRLVRSAEQLVEGGYRALFGLRAPGADTARPASVWRSLAWSLIGGVATSLWTLCDPVWALPSSCWLA